MLFAPVYAKPHPRRTLVSSSRLTPVFPLPAPDSPATKSLAYLDIFLLPCSVFSKSFPCHTFDPPGIVSQHSDVQRSSRFSIYPFSFQCLANSFAFSKSSTLLFSSNSELFTAKHRVAGCPQRSKVQTSDVPALPIRPIAAERLWCNNSQRHGNSSRSEETTRLPSVSKTSERTSGTARRRSRFTPMQSGLPVERFGFPGWYLQTRS